MVTREQLIKFIPIPKNEEVIVYNTDLKKLLDVDVITEYNQLFPVYMNKKQSYIILKEEIDAKIQAINDIYLFNPSWSEEDYLFKLKQDKQTYSTLYGKIKKIEDKLKINQNKIDVMNEKIRIQEEKEKRKIEDKKDTIEKSIEKEKNELLHQREKLANYNQILEIIIKDIQENEEEFQILLDMQENLKTGNYKCKYCGSTVKVCSENSLIYKRLEKNIVENKKELEKLLAKKEKIDLDIAFCENEIFKIKAQLNNDIEFKKNNYNFYTKKTIQVLKLEALRDELTNVSLELEKELKRQPSLNSDKYINLKKDIDRCELSLTNLQKLKKIKEEIQSKTEEYKTKKQEMLELHKKMEMYVEYITIFYKIYEQKANTFFGSDYKFKLFSFKDFELIPIFELTYKGINYYELSKKDKEIVDENLALKISIFD